MATTLADINVTPAWQDVVATHASVANADVLIQSVTTDEVQVVFGGGSAPDGKTGIIIDRRESASGSAESVWVRCQDASATISVTLL